MKYTNENIPGECAECNETVEGLPNMIQHILEMHKEYTAPEALSYAEKWIENAYDGHAEWQMAATKYYKGK